MRPPAPPQSIRAGGRQGTPHRQHGQTTVIFQCACSWCPRGGGRQGQVAVSAPVRCLAPHACIMPPPDSHSVHSCTSAVHIQPAGISAEWGQRHLPPCVCRRAARQGYAYHRSEYAPTIAHTLLEAREAVPLVCVCVVGVCLDGGEGQSGTLPRLKAASRSGYCSASSESGCAGTWGRVPGWEGACGTEGAGRRGKGHSWIIREDAAPTPPCADVKLRCSYGSDHARRGLKRSVAPVGSAIRCQRDHLSAWTSVLPDGEGHVGRVRTGNRGIPQRSDAGVGAVDPRTLRLG